MFGLKPPLYYLPGKAPSDAAASSPHSLSPHSGVSPWGPPQPGDSPLSAPASGSQGQFGGELTFFQRLIRGFGVGRKGERGEQRALARHCSVLGCLDPPLSSCCHSLTLGVSPCLQGAEGVLAKMGWGEKCGMCCVLGCQPRHCEATAIWGTKVCCATPAGSSGPRSSRRGRGIPPGGLGSIGGVGVHAGCVLWGGFGVRAGGSWRCSGGAGSGCVVGVPTGGVGSAHSGCELRM